MSELTLAPRKQKLWRLFLMPVLLLVAAVAWSVFWFYAASKVDENVDAWRAREAKSGRIYDCDRRSVAGFPFRFEVKCSGASVTLQAQTAGAPAPVTVRLGDILVMAQVYDPKLLIAEFAAPATIAGPDQLALKVNWSKARSSIVGLARTCRSAPPSCSTIPRSIASTRRCRRRWRARSMSSCTRASRMVQRRKIR